MALQVKKGDLYLYYCFDVAEEIFLGKIEKIFGAAPQKIPLRYTRLTPPYLQYREAPIFISLGSEKIGQGQFACTAKIYDFGVITIRFALSFKDFSEKDLLRINEQYVGNYDVEQRARSVLARVKGEIKAAMHLVAAAPVDEDYWEDYAIFFVHETQHVMKGTDLVDKYREFVAKLLKSEKRKLSMHEQADAVKYFLSYYEDDIAIIDWNAALLYDPQPGYEVLDVLEYAVIELLELRAYDTLLDQVLDKAYDDIGTKRVKAGTLKSLSQVHLDIADVIEKVENCLKLIGDLYLAKVYNTAAARFYLDRWKSSVNGKLGTIESMYKVLYDRIQTARMMILEALIVLFFIIDLVLIGLPIFFP